MKIKIFKILWLKDQDGISIVLVAIFLLLFLGIAARAIDISHLYAVRNELQNAADAGALAGTRQLYDEDGTLILIDNAKQAAQNSALENKALSESGLIAVDVSNTDIEVGNWNILTRQFSPKNLTGTLTLNDGSASADPNSTDEFINAVKVTARRANNETGGTPATSFFARIFGYDNFALKAEAVAYRGFAGKFGPGEVDLPVALCSQNLTGYNTSTECCPEEDPDYPNCSYDCGGAAFMFSNEDNAAWTNLTQGSELNQPTPGDFWEFFSNCGNANTKEITAGIPVGTTNGTQDSDFTQPSKPDLIDCWEVGTYDHDNDPSTPKVSIDTDGDGVPDQPWNVTILVVNCPGGKSGNNMVVCGAVNIDILWILHKENKVDDDAPYKMGGWDANNADLDGDGDTDGNDTALIGDGEKRWDSFVDYFDIMLPDESDLATYDNEGFKKKSIYFDKDCHKIGPLGGTGGQNFGILAKFPVLVK